MRIGKFGIIIVASLVLWAAGAVASLALLDELLDYVEPVAVAAGLVHDLLIPLSHPLRW